MSLFDTAEHDEESTKVVTSWIRDEKLDGLLPNPPKVTTGPVVAQSNRLDEG